MNFAITSRSQIAFYTRGASLNRSRLFFSFGFKH